MPSTFGEARGGCPSRGAAVLQVIGISMPTVCQRGARSGRGGTGPLAGILPGHVNRSEQSLSGFPSAHTHTPPPKQTNTACTHVAAVDDRVERPARGPIGARNEHVEFPDLDVWAPAAHHPSPVTPHDALVPPLVPLGTYPAPPHWPGSRWGLVHSLNQLLVPPRALAP